MYLNRYQTDLFEEKWKETLASLGLGASMVMSPMNASAATAKPHYSDPVAQKILDYEGYSTKRYFSEGKPHIGIGHLLNPGDAQLFQRLFKGAVSYEKVSAGKQSLTSTQVDILFKHDLQKRINTFRGLYPSYESYPPYLKAALMSSVYRGENHPKTNQLINNNNWEEAAKEYLSGDNFRDSKPDSGVHKRMQANADAFLQYAKELKSKVTRAT